MASISRSNPERNLCTGRMNLVGRLRFHSKMNTTLSFVDSMDFSLLSAVWLTQNPKVEWYIINTLPEITHKGQSEILCDLFQIGPHQRYPGL